ncbi:hypothetical protein [Amycolatopsis nigrescens]|uniref:hypothetical protein n=1 Tax=Amycolatopsis nigrescens TaxID=381445 RepID=UPI000377846F|nr:hypothetical protein [Amycolatopsis nigrescens]
MRIRRAELAKNASRAVTATALAALFTGGILLTGGTASASTVLADGCSGSVIGSMGDQVAVNGPALKSLVRQGAQKNVNALTFLTVHPEELGKAIESKGAIPVGQIPEGASGNVAGQAVGDAVVQALGNANGLGVLDQTKSDTRKVIRDTVTAACGLNTFASNYSVPTPNTPSTTGSPSNSPGSANGGTGTGLPGVSLGTGGTGIAPPRDYGNIPAAVPGVALPPGARYPAGAPMPGQQSPEFGILGTDNTSGQADVRNAGQADALAAPASSSNTVQLPMLLAVVALAGVTAALVRTWVLRRT